MENGGGGGRGRGEEAGCGSVPGYAEAVDVEETITGGDLVRGGYVVWVMGEELGEEVVVDLFGEGVGLVRIASQ